MSPVAGNMTRYYTFPHSSPITPTPTPAIGAQVWTGVAVGYLVVLVALIILPVIREPLTVGIAIALIFAALIFYILFLARPITTEAYVQGSSKCCGGGGGGGGGYTVTHSTHLLVLI